jgi:hypothetical protein
VLSGTPWVTVQVNGRLHVAVMLLLCVLDGGERHGHPEGVGRSGSAAFLPMLHTWTSPGRLLPPGPPFGGSRG